MLSSRNPNNRVAVLVHNALTLLRRWWRVLACAVVLGVVLKHTIETAGSGVGGQGFANVLVQCVFKSYASVESYQKSGVVYRNVTDVLTNQGRNPGGVSYFSADFATDKQHRHNYTDYYDVVLAPYVGRDVNVLEIGVKKGGSLKLWRELFTPASRIFGIDIDPGVPSFPFDANVKTLTFSSLADAYEPEGVVRRAFRGVQFDIIIDDGLHTRSGQLSTFYNLNSFLKPTGVYIVEDIYHVRTSSYLDVRNDWDYAVHVDKSLEERLMFLYPPKSIAARTSVGLLPKVFPSGPYDADPWEAPKKP